MAAFSHDAELGAHRPALAGDSTIPASQKIYNYVSSNIKDNVEPFFLCDETLHQYNLVQIQEDIIAWKVKTWRQQLSKEDTKDLKHLLHEYATAIRDYEYMHSLAQLDVDERDKQLTYLTQHFKPKLEIDPYNARTYLRLHQDSPDELRKFLMRNLHRKLAYSKEEEKKQKDAYSSHKPPLLVSRLVDRLARLILVFIGGSSLIVPMLIMSIHPSKTKSLVTVSIATFFFSFVLSMALRLENNDVLAATAAYAAVLVVFVGTST